jgi:hypothetical protein
MRWEIGKHIKIRPTHQHNVDEDINLQKAGGESKTSKNGHIFKSKLKQNGSEFEVKMYEMGRTMEDVSEGEVEVITINGNRRKELNLKKKFLRA